MSAFRRLHDDYPMETRCSLLNLLPAGSEQHEVLQVGSFQERILQAPYYIVQIKGTHYRRVKLCSKNKKHIRGSTQATILPLATKLIAALQALVSIIA